MITRMLAQTTRQLPHVSRVLQRQVYQRCVRPSQWSISSPLRSQPRLAIQTSYFHTRSRLRAQGLTADALMDNLNDLYATARDEFEIAAEETEKKTVYAEDDRAAAREALTTLKEAFEKAIKESDPEVAKEVTTRTGQRIRELENAVIAMEEMATMGD